MGKSWFRSFGMAAAFVFAAGAAHATGALFSPLEVSPAYGKALNSDLSYRALADNPSTAALQIVRANAATVNEAAARVDLNLGAGLDLKVRRLEAYRSPSGGLVWTGVIEDAFSGFSPDQVQFDPLNTVTLVRDGEMITGNIHYQGEWYKIRPLKSGGHALVQVDQKAMPPDHPAEYASLPVISAPVRRPASAKANTVIRVMAHYTPAAAAAAGNISSLIDLAVAESNQGYTNSGVTITLQLATKAQVNYTESGSFSTDLSRYRGTADGYMDSIHTTRNSVTADVGVLLINNTSACGLASGIGSTASTAFAAVYWDCATGYYSFAHEIGHLQSARHDPANDPTTTPYAWGHGYQYTASSPKWRTIMAYDCSGGCPRLNYWSNPNNLYSGHPMGTTTKNHNARVLNDTRATVAAFR